ncbi:MAG TPA: cell envelope integrity protein CreD, partial [Arenimonas sp.]|uniref:cell envelope integrity protein CreD n=1 Tax=Arenimonas sp. TaxID=1872635 RepID=UPI002D80004E
MRIGWKLGLVGFLLVVLLLPLAMLDGLVAERQQRGLEVAEDIARSSAGPQSVVGPLLLVEARRPVERKRVVSRDGHLSQETEQDTETVHYLVSPETLAIDARLRTERRGRSLFSVPLYHGSLGLKGRLVHAPRTRDGVRLEPVRAWLVLGLGDNRGVRALGITLGGRKLAVQPGTRVGWLPEGLGAPVPVAMLAAPMDFTVSLDLSGTQRLGWLPVGADTTVSLVGDWPHPGFEGRHLPDARKIDETGFEARWAVSRLSSRVQQVLAGCVPTATHCSALEEGEFSVRLVEPVDRYLMTERAIKYALLFLALVFGAVFLVEALAARPVHVVQYGLTGLAMAMFYLLLLSLSEHLGFGPAYAIAAAACSGLVGFYLGGVLGGRGRGGAFGAGLAVLYGLLYVLLRSEDHALLVGAVVLFGALAG